ERRYRPHTDDERQRILSEAGKKRLQESARVKAIADPGAVVQAVLNDMGIGVAVIQKPNKSFVIGSKPIVKLNPPGETRLGQPDVEAWLPIAADVAVCPVPGKDKEIIMTLDDDRWLRGFNVAILRESTLIAGRSEALVSSLVSER